MIQYVKNADEYLEAIELANPGDEIIFNEE